MKKILHIAPVEKFIPSFIAMINDNKNNFPDTHEFILIDDGYFNMKNIIASNVVILNNKNKIKKLFYIIKKLLNCDQLIIHGLFDSMVMIAAKIFKYKGHKFFWLIWGKDLYAEFYKESLLKKCVKNMAIKSIKNTITYIIGDFNLLKSRYNVNPKNWECIAYESNVIDCNFKFNNSDADKDGKINILIGNSADATNCHKEAFDLVKNKFINVNYSVYCPLSYAINSETESVVDYGYKLFGDKFHPLKNFMTIDEYNNLLDSIDVSVFMHKRQQAMGNILNLIGRGKKVYIRSNVSSWQTLIDFGVVVFDVMNIDNEKIHNKIAENNVLIIKNNFSKERLISQWEVIFNYNRQ